MSNLRRSWPLAILLLIFSVTGAPYACAAESRPNILVIVADDLGYSDMGAFGGEIATPNLDSLSLNGARFAHYQVGATCSLTRSMLMSGVDNHLAGVGAMAELLVDEQRGKPGYEGYMNDRVASLAEIMKAAGYGTYMSGKWHLGYKDDQIPASRGFEHSFVLLDGGANHFSGRPFLQFKEGKPNSPSYREDGNVASWPEGKYSADVYTDKMIGYLEMAKQKKDQPFLAYMAYTTPHWPVQAPAEDIAKYKGRYDAGYDVLRKQRLEGLKKRGLLPPDATVAQTYDNVFPKWDSLSPEEKQVEARLMEVYAAMVDRMDQNVGRLIAALKANGQYDNTLIFFMSDNGASGENPLQFGATREYINAHYNNALSNLGSGDSYLSYGPRWAMVSASPFRMFKGYAFEGGLTSPMFFAGAKLPEAARGHVFAQFAHVTDVAPTILDFAGIKQPDGTFEGRTIYKMEGSSLKTLLTKADNEPTAAAQRPVGSELMGNQSLRDGDWKIAYSNTPWGKGQWELFNIAKDPGETQDLAQDEPQQLERMKKLWLDYVKEHGVVDDPAFLTQEVAKQLDPRSHFMDARGQ